MLIMDNLSALHCTMQFELSSTLVVLGKTWHCCNIQTTYSVIADGITRPLIFSDKISFINFVLVFTPSVHDTVATGLVVACEKLTQSLFNRSLWTVSIALITTTQGNF